MLYWAPARLIGHDRSPAMNDAATEIVVLSQKKQSNVRLALPPISAEIDGVIPNSSFPKMHPA
jgi:hypothetical protein